MPLIVTFQIFSVMTFFLVFSKKYFFRKFNFKVSQNFQCCSRNVRALSGVENLASKCDSPIGGCSNRFRDVMFFN